MNSAPYVSLEDVYAEVKAVTFYDRYVELCKSKKVSPSRAAEECGINKANVSTWKNQGYTPRGEALQKIADCFGVSVDYLLTGEQQKSPRHNAEDDDADGSKAELIEEYRPIKNNFSSALKYLREREELTQVQLAAALGISRSTVGMYETGEREPDFKTLESLTDYFNVDMNFLFGKKQHKIPRQNAEIEDQGMKIVLLKRCFGVANQIRTARERLGIRQVDLAKQLGVTQATLSNWERGEYEPDNESLRKLSRFLGVSIDYLLTGEQQKSPRQNAEDDGAADFGRKLFAAHGDLAPQDYTQEDIEDVAMFLKIKRKRPAKDE